MPDGRQEATIWDSNVSEFSTGLELTHFFECVSLSTLSLGADKQWKWTGTGSRLDDHLRSTVCLGSWLSA
jgi:hypothetical protein